MMSQHEWVASTHIGGKEEVAPDHQAANIKAAASPLEHQTLEQICNVCGNVYGNHLMLIWGCMWGIKVHQKQASLLEATA